MEERKQGTYAEWKWDPMRKCWEYLMPLRIYVHDDGHMSVSSNDVWHSGVFDSFEAAELEAFCGD